MTNSIYQEVINRLKNLDLYDIHITDKDVSLDYVFSDSKKVNVHSISKMITGICIGIAIEQNIFPQGLDEPIMKYFKNTPITNKLNIKFLENAKIKHLLSLTLGHEERLLDSQQISRLNDFDLVEFVLNYPIKHEPGTHFVYTSATMYLASVIITRATDYTLLEFAKKNLFSKLNITDVDWLESKQGYNLGATGLIINGYDLHKVGLMILQDGKYEGYQIVSRQWVDEMRTIQSSSSRYYNEERALPKYGYGFNLWICKSGIYFCDGTDGQYVIMIPHKNRVITTVGNQKDMSYITEYLRPILE